jgi:hypothetical protein
VTCTLCSISNNCCLMAICNRKTTYVATFQTKFLVFNSDTCPMSSIKCDIEVKKMYFIYQSSPWSPAPNLSMVTAVYLRAPERESTYRIKRKHVRKFVKFLSSAIQLCEVCLCINLYFTSTTCNSSIFLCIVQKTVDLKFRAQICHPTWVSICSSFVLCVPLFIPVGWTTPR